MKKKIKVPMEKEKILQIYDFAVGKKPLNKAQIEVRLKAISKDEEEICKFIDFVYARQLVYKFTEKRIMKLFNHIATAKYARWILKHNLSFNRVKLIGIISKNVNESVLALIEQLPLTEKENNKLFNKVLTDINMIILLLGSNTKLNDYQKTQILNIDSQINRRIDQIEEDLKQNYYQYIISDKTDKKYIELITKAKIYLEHLRETKI